MTIFYGQQSHNQITAKENVIADVASFEQFEPQTCRQFRAVTLSFHSVSPTLFFATNTRTHTCCVADAYISNKKELYGFLSISDKEGQQWSDAELILACYHQWGIDCLKKLCGDFVFAIWDPGAQQFFLVRDPMGQRSIFYHITHAGEIYFSNTVKMLVEQFGISKTINPQKAASFLTLLIEDGELTFYKEISKIPAGFYLRSSTHKSQQLVRYWDAQNFLESPLLLQNKEDFYSHFRHLFEDVVQSYIPRVGHVASHLSGGLDSSSVSAVAAQLLQKDQKKLTTFGHIPLHQSNQSPFKRWSYCDKSQMEAFTKKYRNVTHHYISTQTFHSYSLQFQAWMDQPAINPTNMPWLVDCAMRARNMDIFTILTGQGGNMTISWPLHPIVEPTWSLRGMLSSIKQRGKLLVNPNPWREYCAVHPELARKTNLNHYFMKEEKSIYDADPRAYYFNHNMMDFAASIYMPMRCLLGVNHFDPTLDVRIVEFCLRAPLTVFQDEQRSRLLVREGLKDLLPNTIRDRTIRGMQAADWYMEFEKNKRTFHDYLTLWQKNHISEYLDIKSLLQLLKQWNCQTVQQSQGSLYKKFVYQYQLKFLRAIECGLFLTAMDA